MIESPTPASLLAELLRIRAEIEAIDTAGKYVLWFRKGKVAIGINADGVPYACGIVHAAAYDRAGWWKAEANLDILSRGVFNGLGERAELVTYAEAKAAALEQNYMAAALFEAA